MTSVEDVVYHQPPGGPLLARLYRPDRPPVAAMVSVHGGRWCVESRLSNEVIDRALADAGVLVMALDFRQPPLARHPAAVADINLGIRWLKQHVAAAFPIGGIGTSSGGHQLLLTALRPDDECFASEALPGDVDRARDASLDFAIACWPVTDPLARFRYAVDNDMVLHVDSHHAYWRDEADMARGSPLRIVEAGEATLLPPLLLVQGTADNVLPPGMTARFAESWSEAGGAVELVEFEGQAHTFITKTPDSPASQAALSAIVDFARRPHAASTPGAAST